MYIHIYGCMYIYIYICIYIYAIYFSGGLVAKSLFATPWTVAHQSSLAMGFSRQEYWSGLPFPPPGDLPDPGIEPVSPVSPAWLADSLPLSHLGSPAIYMLDAHTKKYYIKY